jgi:DNA mismatch endonuclease (patch repair protein)
VKLAENQQRDRNAAEHLTRSGWRVFTIWECETRHPDRLQAVLDRLVPFVAETSFDVA